MAIAMDRDLSRNPRTIFRYFLVWCLLCWSRTDTQVAARGASEAEIDVTGYPLTCNDYYVRSVATGTTPADGIYTVNFEGAAMSVYCDMSRHGGGWTLVLTSPSSGAFASLALLYEGNSVSPSLSNQYSILSKADNFKNGAISDKMMYRIETYEPGRYGGIWEIPINYTFVSTAPDQPSSLVQKFDEWTPSVDSVQDVVPWIYDDGSEQFFTTNGDIASGNYWGSLACVMCYPKPGYPDPIDPTPWMKVEMPVPGIIWYWIKEYRELPESQCDEGDRFDHWKTVSNDKETFLSMALVRPEDVALSWETAWKALTIMTTYTSEDCLYMAIGDLVLVHKVLRTIAKTNLTTASNVLEPLTKNFIQTSGRLLNVDNVNEWQRGKEVMGPSVVLETIGEFANNVADAMAANTSVDAQTDNIRMSIQSMTLKEASENGMRFPARDSVRDVGEQGGGWISASAESLQEISKYYADDTQISMISLLYSNLTELLKYDVSGGDVYTDSANVILGENVISTSWRIQGHEVSVPVTYELPLRVQDSQVVSNNNNNEMVSACTFLEFADTSLPDYSGTRWSSKGCEVRRSSNINIQCHCNHTTNFAVLMTVIPFELSDTHSQILRYITYTGCSVSIVAMIGTLTLYSYLKSLLPAERISIHKNLIVAIMISQTISMATESAAQHRISCKVFAVILHYACTAMFMWMLAEGIHLYRQIVAVYGSERSWMNYYYAMAWGLPFLIVAITAGMRIDDYGSNNHCWLSVEDGVIWAFVGPAILIMAANLLVLILVVRVVVSASQNSGHKQNDHVKAGVKSSLLLLPLLGITWCFGLFATGDETIVFLYIFAVLNSLQGLFIFLFHVVYNSEVRAALRRKKEKFEAERGQFVHSTLATVSKNGSRYARSFTTKSTRVTRMSSEQTLHLEDVINDVKMLDAEEVDQPKKVATVSHPATDTLPRKSLTVYPSEPAVGMKKRKPEFTTHGSSKDQLTLNRPCDEPW